MSLRVTPISSSQANEFVVQHHRHHKPLKVGYLFSIAVSDDDGVRGVAIVGMPTTWRLVDGFTAEVRRVATDGADNACSMLYAACWRACRAMGYARLLTYTLESESGASLRGAGWKVVGQTKGRTWNAPGRGRPRVDWHPTLTTGEGRIRWEAA